MKKCPKCSAVMRSTFTKAGVIVERCSGCGGFWLDRGELQFFADNEKIIDDYEKKGLVAGRETKVACPSCQGRLRAGLLPGTSLEVEECDRCRGLFLAEKELKLVQGKANSAHLNKLSPESFTKSPDFKMPSLAVASSTVFISLYGAFFALAVFLVELGLVDSSLAFTAPFGLVFIQFLIGPWIMDFNLRFLGSMSWIPQQDLPRPFQMSLAKLCRQHRLPLPKVGIINDGSPQAFTYGRTPKSARLVFSQGMFELLDEDELEAVIAHELGHIKHWDFVVMTLVKIVPLVLYQLYRSCMRASSRKSSSSRKGSGQGALVAAVVTFIAYKIADYLVMLVSRVREYHADRFSCLATKKPNALVSALVKIGLGLARFAPQGSDLEESKHEGRKRKAVEAMNIMNFGGAKEMALAYSEEQPGHSTRVESIKDIMRWDLWSPWASYYEIHSTHPLTSKRINAIAHYAKEMGQTPDVVFDLERPESYWDDFAWDIVILFLPVILGLTFIGVNHAAFPVTEFSFSGIVLPFSVGAAIGGVIKTVKSYPTQEWISHSVVSLLRKVKVSPVRSYSVKLTGQIIGRGEAGNLFSEDMVLQDRTGLIFLDHEPFGFNFFFALFKIEQFRGESVTVEGWYRRSPIPFIEVKRIRSASSTSQSFTYYYKMLAWFALPLVAYALNRLEFF